MEPDAGLVQKVQRAGLTGTTSRMRLGQENGAADYLLAASKNAASVWKHRGLLLLRSALNPGLT
jgi:hypothetical protein